MNVNRSMNLYDKPASSGSLTATIMTAAFVILRLQFGTPLGGRHTRRRNDFIRPAT
jgi:hypothetical protein